MFKEIQETSNSAVTRQQYVIKMLCFDVSGLSSGCRNLSVAEELITYR